MAEDGHLSLFFCYILIQSVMSTLKNSVRLMGYLGSDPDVKTFDNNRSLARVAIATHERYRNAQGEWVTDTQWHNLVFWGRHAVFAQKSLTKGSEVCIEGKLVNRQYVDKDGITRYITEVNVNEVQPLDRKTEKTAHLESVSEQ